MTPTLVACWDGELYKRFADVLKATAAKHCSTWNVQLSHVKMKVNQASKLAHWVKAVDAAPDGTPMLLMDADTMILRSLDDLWERPFDIAYCVRNPAWSKWPNNAGVVAVRASCSVRAFLHEWLQRELPLLKTTGPTRKAWLSRYGAVEQAALEQTLANSSLQIERLPCVEWNCEDSSWAHADGRTRIVHLKGAMRAAIVGRVVSPTRRGQIGPLLGRWIAVDRSCRGVKLSPARSIGTRPAIPSIAPHTGSIDRAGGRYQVVSDALYSKEWQAQRTKKYAPAAQACLRTAIEALGKPGSLFDVGCGSGALVASAGQSGIDARGVDVTLTGADHADLNHPLDLGRSFDLVLCWEVAEHLAPESADTLCDTLVRHLTPGGVLLFTAAAIGQDGYGHINCQSKEYWGDKLYARGLMPDAALTSTLGGTWKSVAGKAFWYGENLQVWRARGDAAHFAPIELPSVALTMRTANRTPKRNYLKGTLQHLANQGFDLTDLHLCVTKPGSEWLAGQFKGLQKTPTLHIPKTILNANQNGLAQARHGIETGAAWVVMLEDDLDFCADFVNSLRRWLKDADRPTRHVFRCFGFTTPPQGFKGSFYDWPLPMLRGSQAICLRRDDAIDFLEWGTKHINSWCRTTSWRNPTANPGIAFDKFVAAWATAKWPRVPCVMSHPYFVNHIGNESSIHSRGVRNDAPFAGTAWRYVSEAFA